MVGEILRQLEFEGLEAVAVDRAAEAHRCGSLTCAACARSTMRMWMDGFWMLQHVESRHLALGFAQVVAGGVDAMKYV